MKVSTKDSFQVIYSLYEHEYLGYIFESFIIKQDHLGHLTLQHQNISSLNAHEFKSGLDTTDFELIDLMDNMQQDKVVPKFLSNGIKPKDFFLKYFNGNDDDKSKAIQTEIGRYMSNLRSQIMEKLVGKRVFEMGSDGEPTWKELDVMPEKATVLFHFRKNEENTHYFPTIKYNGQKLEFQYKKAYLVCNKPAWLVLDGRIYSFEKDVDGSKLKPFLNKKFIVVPKNVEKPYYEKFIAPLIAVYDVYARGFEIDARPKPLQPVLTFSPLAQTNLSLFDEEETVGDKAKIVFELNFQYGSYEIRADISDKVVVRLEEKEGGFIFHRINRWKSKENDYLRDLENTGLSMRSARLSLPVSEAIKWIKDYTQGLEEKGFTIKQLSTDKRKFFLGEASIKVEITENIDWFDINAVIKFGDYSIPFKELRKLLRKNKNEITLPNGEIAVIPDAWVEDYGEIFGFINEDDTDKPMLAKHHLALVQEVDRHESSNISIDKKLLKLQDFTSIKEREVSNKFKGTLRPYQKAGYDWLLFLNDYKFGGCLADDMGLGKTVQTLALLQHEKDKNATNASLLIMPTSLIYNWKREARKFTPSLKVYDYTGSNRQKDISLFEGYDLVVTSYGIVRRDIEELMDYYFNYVILDESQSIKNPASNISKAVRKLSSKHRLILSGTPLENSTLDLWSQMSFVNPGLLGQQAFFKKKYQVPIEKHQSEEHTQKLFNIIKPFILRRHKSQVANDLPEKVENIHYSRMSDSQREVYEKVKNHYRNEILNHIESFGVNKSQLLLLQGLTKLRQIANHPKLVDQNYTGDSGKMDDLLIMLDNALAENHKILIFSQFVKHLTIVREVIENLNLDYCYLDGATKDREAQVERFQNDEDVRLFLISLKAGGLGLNLTEADYVLLLDPWWNPAVEMQAIDRAHRIGQTKKVFTYKYIMSDTVEEKILDLQKRKVKLAKDLISTDQGFVKNLSKDDISALLT
ncbi:MAG: SNF2-related protein [Bacteroidota bacterium]